MHTQPAASLASSIESAERERARIPHELATINLMVFNILIGVALLAGSIADRDSLLARWHWPLVALPLLISLLFMAYTGWRARQLNAMAPRFVAAHWRLAARRYRIVLLAYAICAGLLLFGALSQRPANPPPAPEITTASHSPSPAMLQMQRHKHDSQHLGLVIWTRLAVVPLIIGVLIAVVLESSAIQQARHGELPKSMLAQPPPDDGA